MTPSVTVNCVAMGSTGYTKAKPRERARRVELCLGDAGEGGRFHGRVSNGAMPVLRDGQRGERCGTRA